MKNSILAVTAFTIGLLTLDVSACGDQSRTSSEQTENTALQVEQGHEAGQLKDGAKVKNGFKGMPKVGTKAVCPVMGSEFTVTKDTQSSVYKGKTYVFCCAGCKPAFEKNPEKYLGK